MEHFGPLLQTILWVLLIAGVVWRFNVPIHGLLTALQKRIESGSNLKAGPFELSAQVQPQAVEQQVLRTEAEVAEVVQSEAEDGNGLLSPSKVEVQSRFLEAEDLALRAIQVHYGKPISRQISLGPDFAADGAFTTNGGLSIVEVKYMVRPTQSYNAIRRTMDFFQVKMKRYRYRNVRVVLAVVIESASDVEKIRSDLIELVQNYEFGVDVHCFSVSDLRARFGIVAR
jgi:hypothetical protein